MKKISFILLFASLSFLQAQEHERLLNLGADPNFEYNAQLGRELYLKECARCHGNNGEKKAYREADRLSKMSAKDIESSLRQYKIGNTEFGGKQANVMRLRASSLSNEDIGNIITYLKGEDAFKYYHNPKENKDISRKVSKQGLYLE